MQLYILLQYKVFRITESNLVYNIDIIKLIIMLRIRNNNEFKRDLVIVEIFFVRLFSDCSI